MVKIGDIKAAPVEYVSPMLHEWTMFYLYHEALYSVANRRPRRFPGTPAAARPRPNVTVKAAKGVDLNAEGEIDGVPTYDFDIESIKVEDRPWRKPGIFNQILSLQDGVSSCYIRPECYSIY